MLLWCLEQTRTAAPDLQAAAGEALHGRFVVLCCFLCRASLDSIGGSPQAGGFDSKGGAPVPSQGQCGLVLSSGHSGYYENEACQCQCIINPFLH